MFWTRSKSFFPRATFGGDPLSLFNRFMGNASEMTPAFPAFNIWSDEDGAVLTSELPGVKMEDLDITVSGKEIAIKGSRKADTAADGRYVRHERTAGDFARSFQLPFQIDSSSVQAKLTDGLLRIDLPRAENDKPRKIAVSSV